MPRSLSKSRLLKGFRCPKMLHFTLFPPDPEAPQEPDPATEHQFTEGREVGAQAREEFPGGVLIDAEHFDFAGALQQTAPHLLQGSTTPVLFEAGFEWRSFFCRVDVLRRVPRSSQWDLIEVKKSNSVDEDKHLADAAIQKIIAQNSGLSIRKVILMHLNRECVYPDLSNLFTLTDITAEVEAVEATTLKTMKRLEQAFITDPSPAVPDVDIGPHCTSPYECAFQDICWKKLPTPNLWDIPKLREQWKLYDQGVVSLTQLKKTQPKPDIAEFIDCHLLRRRKVNADPIRRELARWKWPLTLIDFETISYPIPRLAGTRPYDPIPFQVAASVWTDPSAAPTEHDWLDLDAADPREGLARHLAESLPSTGSVVAYNQGFESRILTELALAFPQYRARLLSLKERLVDPLPIFRNHVYDPAMGKSFSLKSVAPALLGAAADYGKLEVGDGVQAQVAYLRARDPATPPSERERLRKALITYCRQDTELTRRLVEWLMVGLGNIS